MRRAAWLVTIGIVASGSPAQAQPFDFLFGRSPTPSHRAYRRPRRPSRRSAALPAAVPLPVPRPHFAEDRAFEHEPPTAAKAPDLPNTPAPAEARAPDAARGQPAVSAATNEPTNQLPPASPPLPVPRPTDLTHPSSAATTAAPAEQPGTAATVAPSGATTAFTPRQPSEDAACIDRLKAEKAGFEAISIGPQPDPRCTVVQAVRLSSLSLPDGSTVAFPDRPTIACTTADTFSAYVGQLLAPLARGSFGTALTTVWTGPGLECRSRDSIFGAKLSAHGQGLAVDVAQIRLADGRKIEVGTPKGDVDQAFETAARAGACGYFHTVLGPGTDSYHRTHWHFDLEVRGKSGDSKYCK